MALAQATLRDALRSITDPAYIGWLGFPTTPVAVGIAWGAIVRAYFQQIASPPGITSLQHDAAQAAFSAVFQPVWYGDGLLLLNGALTAYATLMVPSTGVVVPPIGTPAWVLAPTTDGAAAADAIASAIDAWVRTGTYTAPAGSPVPWA